MGWGGVELSDTSAYFFGIGMLYFLAVRRSRSTPSAVSSLVTLSCMALCDASERLIRFQLAIAYCGNSSRGKMWCTNSAGTRLPKRASYLQMYPSRLMICSRLCCHRLDVYQLLMYPPVSAQTKRTGDCLSFHRRKRFTLWVRRMNPIPY